MAMASRPSRTIKSSPRSLGQRRVTVIASTQYEYVRPRRQPHPRCIASVQMASKSKKKPPTSL